MKILFVGHAIEARGGVARSARRLIGSLSARGHQLCCCLFDPDLFASDAVRSGDTWRFGTAGPQEHTDQVLAAIAHHQPQVVLGWYGSTAGLPAVAAARLAGVGVVLALRGNDVDRDFFDERRHAHLVWACRQATARTVVSREMARKLSAWMGVEATFISNSVDRRQFHPDPAAGRAFRRRHALPETDLVLGMFGEIKPKRGLDRVVDLPGTLLVVGSFRDGLAHALPPSARTVPYLSDDAALRGAYCACDAVLQPSRHDGMPNVVLEAMACGRPVLVSRVGGLRDLVDPGTTGLHCSSPLEWRAAVASLPREDLGRAAMAAVPQPEEEAAAFEAVLQRAARA